MLRASPQRSASGWKVLASAVKLSPPHLPDRQPAGNKDRCSVLVHTTAALASKRWGQNAIPPAIEDGHGRTPRTDLAYRRACVERENARGAPIMARGHAGRDLGTSRPNRRPAPTALRERGKKEKAYVTRYPRSARLILRRRRCQNRPHPLMLGDSNRSGPPGHDTESLCARILAQV